MSLNSFQQNTYQGRVAIGEKADIVTRSNKKVTIPKKLDYFVFTKLFDPKSQTAPKDLATTANIKKKYGTDKPKEIEVILVDDHYDTAFYTNYLNYPGKTCNCKGDGVNAVRVDSNGVKTKVKCDYEHCEFRLTKTGNGVINTCKPTGILTFLLPEASVSGGVWKFVTHSQMTIGKVRGSLKNLFQGVSLSGLKVRLKVQIVPVNIPKQGTQNVPTVELDLPYGWDTLAERFGAKTFEELCEKRSGIVKTLPDNKRMEELSTAVDKGEGYDGSMDNEELPPPPPDMGEIPPMPSNIDDSEFRV